MAGLGGDVRHIKQTTSVGTSLPLGAGVTLSVGLRTGLHLPLSKRSFISDRFFLGGIDTFRGFERSGMSLALLLCNITS
jgi:outer membrane protein assembly factor BamA